MNWKSSRSKLKDDVVLEQAAQDATQLAIFLKAGLTPRRVVELVQPQFGGESAPSWLLSRVWEIATTQGVAPAECLLAYATSFEESAHVLRQARAVQAGPLFARRIIIFLPVIALMGSSVLGNNAVAFLVTNPLGWALMILAGALTWVAHVWTKKLTDQATYIDVHAGQEADLCALFLAAGYPLTSAQNQTHNVLPQAKTSAGSETHKAEMEKILTFSQTEGVPAVTLLRALASRHRRLAHSRMQIRVEELSVKLIVPLGVCILPAFILVGVLPVAITMLSSTVLR